MCTLVRYTKLWRDRHVYLGTSDYLRAAKMKKMGGERLICKGQLESARKPLDS